MAKLSRDLLIKRLRDIRMLALDVDGVLTDDSLYFGPDGFEAKKFNISDGFFMVLAMRSGLELAVVSGRYSPATESRMKDLGVKYVLQEMRSKVAQIVPLLKKLDIEFSQVAFMGNEILDIELARKVGLSIAVADAAQELIQVTDYVTCKKGGCGAVREVLQCYFEAVGKDPQSYIV